VVQKKANMRTFPISWPGYSVILGVRMTEASDEVAIAQAVDDAAMAQAKDRAAQVHASHISGLLRQAETGLTHATIALAHFESAVATAAAEWAKQPISQDPYIREAPFFFARSFIFALDLVDNNLSRAGQEASEAPGVAEASRWLVQRLPDLNAVRDSAARGCILDTRLRLF
jgi:hypothetical protein